MIILIGLVYAFMSGLVVGRVWGIVKKEILLTTTRKLTISVIWGLCWIVSFPHINTMEQIYDQGGS